MIVSRVVSHTALSGLFCVSLRNTRAQAFAPFSLFVRHTSTLNMSKLDTELSGKMQLPISEAIQYHSDLIFVDGSWWLGQRDTTSRQDFEAGPRILNARYFDIDDVCLPKQLNPKNLPHMMPTPKIFAAAMDAMEIRNDDHVVIYGQAKCPFLHRTWLQFASMGHELEKLHLLGGSLQEWIDAKGQIDEQPSNTFRIADLDLDHPAKYVARPPWNVVSFEEMHQIISESSDDTMIVDVRSADRYWGKVPEPRPGLLRGHMPGAKNLFFLNLLDESNPNKLKTKDELFEVIEDSLGSDVWSADRRVVASCGSGATACTVSHTQESTDHRQELTLIWGFLKSWLPHLSLVVKTHPRSQSTTEVGQNGGLMLRIQSSTIDHLDRRLISTLSI